MDKIIRQLADSEHCVAFTGAGISTFSGIRDFRGKNGLYRDEDAGKIFDLDYFRKDPGLYYRRTRDFIYNLNEREPGIVHTELARLEKAGIVKTVITQNIDLLHQKAGSGDVIELHGSPLIHRCLDCGETWSYEEICAKLVDAEVPVCGKCGGIIKPDIVFFGEQLPGEAIERAVEEAEKADFLLVLGSSLLVQPAASLPFYTIQAGGTVVIVNDMPTPLDGYAERRFEDLGEFFRMTSEII